MSSDRRETQRGEGVAGKTEGKVEQGVTRECAGGRQEAQERYREAYKDERRGGKEEWQEGS